MPTLSATDGTRIFYKVWRSGQAIVFSQGWPLSGDDWTTNVVFWAARLLSDRMTGEGAAVPPRLRTAMR